MTPTTSKLKSSLSLAEAKELIAFARSQRVVALDFEGLQFRFSPAAFDEPDETPKKKQDEDVSPFGHHKPE
jgi:hypothetical protein